MENALPISFGSVSFTVPVGGAFRWRLARLACRSGRRSRRIRPAMQGPGCRATEAVIPGRLPVSEKEPSPCGKPQQSATDLPLRVLVVDDSPEVLEVLGQLIGGIRGIEVRCHLDPRDALDEFTASSGQFDLVVTDLDLPGMDGVAFLNRLRRIDPSLVVVLETGGAITPEIRSAGFTKILQKPLELFRIRDVVAELLSSRRDSTHSSIKATASEVVVVH